MSDPQPCSEINDHERTPLLTRSQTANTVASHFSAQTARASKSIIYTFMLMVLLVSFGDQLLESPQTRVQEAVICYQYYEKVDPSKIRLSRREIGPGAIGGVDELWCKAGKVQSDLALLRGWQLFYDGIPSLVLAVPFGWGADKYGRKPFLLAGLVAVTCRAAWIAFVTSFPFVDIRWTWLSTLFSCLGGGASTPGSLAFVVLSDVTTEAERGGVFLQVGSFNLLANFVMPPLAAWLMAEYTPWIPILGGITLSAMSVVLFAFTSETLNFQRRRESRSMSSGSDATENRPIGPLSHDSIPTKTSSLWLKDVKAAASFLSEDWRIPVLMLPFIVYMLIGSSGQLIIQFMSARFNITFAKATLVATIRNGMVALVLFFLLPQLSSFMIEKKHFSPQRKDLTLARISQVFMCIGWIAFGLAPTLTLAVVALIIEPLDQGAPFLLRSFLTSLLPHNRIARAFSVITIVDTIGVMLGAPLLAGLLKSGFTLGGFWIGLPFYFVGVVSGLLAILLSTLALLEGDRSGSDDEDN